MPKVHMQFYFLIFITMEIIKFEDTEVKIDYDSKWREDIWLTQDWMARLFKKDRTAISKHVTKIYKDKEVWKDTCRETEKKYTEGKNKWNTYKVNEYNLDVILSIWFKVNWKIWVKFRRWANQVLWQYLTQGYVVNEKVMLERWMGEIVTLLNNCKKTLIEFNNWHSSEMDEVIWIIEKYAWTFTDLQNYDSKNFTLSWSQKEVKYILTSDDAFKFIDEFKKRLIAKWEATIMFGQEKSKWVLSSIIHTIFNWFFWQDAYEYLEEKASQLLYLLVKDHPFTDWNKRIATFLFVTFLEKNNFMHKKNWTQKLSRDALTFLALLIAQSQPSDRDVLVKLLVSVLRDSR